MAASDPQSYTIKPRRRARRQVLLTAVLVLAIPAAAHWIWSYHAERQLLARIDALHSAGEPVTPEDFQRLEQDGPGNAASDITAAATILDDDTVYSGSVDAVPSTQPVAPEAWPYLEASVKWFEPALRRIDRADGKPICSWSHRYRSPIFEHLLVPELNQCRMVSRLLITSSQVAHHHGNDDVVVRRLHQMLFLGRAADRSPTMIGHLVSLAIVASAAVHIEAVAPNLRIGEEAAGEVSPRTVRALIDALLDDTETSDGLRKAMLAERMDRLDMVDSFLLNSPDLDLSLMRYLDRPWRLRAELATLDQCSKAAAILETAGDWPSAAASLQTLPPLQGLHAFDDAGERNSINRMALDHFQCLTDRRLAATALAIRLYIVDHGDRFPSTLEDLVPTYLPEVPKDPMSPSRQPIRYLARAKHPVLYSVGTNGMDDGGSEAALPNKFGDLNEWERLDRLFYLSLQPREELYVPRPAGYTDEIAGDDYDPRTPWERHDPITPDWHPSTQP